MTPKPREMKRWPVEPGKTALLVVDMENDFVQEGATLEVPRAREMVAGLRRLIDSCRQADLPIIFIRHVLRPDGSDAGRMADINPLVRERQAIMAGSQGVEIFAPLGLRPTDILVDKRRYSAFWGTDLESILRTRGIDTLIISGTLTNVCCDSTARDAFSRDYKLIFLSDGTATRDWPDLGWGAVSAEEAQRVVLTVLAYSFGRVATMDEIEAEVNTLVTASHSP